MADWIEWANLLLGIIGAAGTAGVVILVYQWYVDAYSKAPLKFDGPSRGWWTTRDDSENASFNLNIRNRRTSSAKVLLLVGPPKRDDPYLTSGNLADVHVWILPGFWPTGLHLGAEVPPKGEVPLALMAKLPDNDYVGPIRVVVFDQGLRLASLDYRIRPGDPKLKAAIERQRVHGPQGS
jgi:hypothetical protein